MSDPKDLRPIQAGDYGKDNPAAPKAETEKGAPAKTDKPETDGRKTLGLWKHDKDTKKDGN